MELKSKIKPSKSLEKVVIEDLKMAFDVFFDAKVKAGKLGFWQKQEILVFFEHHGLTKIEDLERFESVLKLY